ncbi:hypothetical protein MBLNU459_g5359t1 [Dothideomycetes sp. NU459]
MGVFEAEHVFLRNLGSGGFGRVDKFKNRISGEVVAVKTAIHPDSSEDLAEEVANLRRIPEHENIGKFIDYIPSQDRIIMQAYTGPDLQGLIKTFQKRNFKVPEAFVFHVFSQLTSALKHLRDAGFTHRDVKPANVVCDSRHGHPNGIFDKIVLIDFGLASNVTTPHFEPCGTPKWGAVEGPVHSTAYDIYCVGAIVHGLCTFRPPIEDAPDYMAYPQRHTWYARAPQKKCRIVDPSHADFASENFLHACAWRRTFVTGPRFPLSGYSPILEYWMNRALDVSPALRADIDELMTGMKPDAVSQIDFWTKWVQQVCRPQGMRCFARIGYLLPPTEWQPAADDA